MPHKCLKNMHSDKKLDTHCQKIKQAETIPQFRIYPTGDIDSDIQNLLLVNTCLRYKIDNIPT